MRVVIEPRKVSWTGHLERMGSRRGVTVFWWGDLRERDSLEHLYVDRRTLLKWLFKKWDGGHGLD
jgi:hypothetical protein